jgi:hypothetical protein
MALVQLIKKSSRFAFEIFLARAGVKEQAFDAVDDAEISHAAVFGGCGIASIFGLMLISLDGDPQRFFGNGGGEPGRRIEESGRFFAPVQPIVIRILQGNGIPPPDPHVHGWVGKKVAPVVFEFFNDIFGIAQDEWMVRVQLARDPIQRHDIRQARQATRDALL